MDITRLAEQKRWLIIADSMYSHERQPEVDELEEQLKDLGFIVHVAQIDEALEWNKTLLPDVVQLKGYDDDWVQECIELGADNYSAEYVLFPSRVDSKRSASSEGVRVFDVEEDLLAYAKTLTR